MVGLKGREREREIRCGGEDKEKCGDIGLGEKRKYQGIRLGGGKQGLAWGKKEGETGWGREKEVDQA